jgi:hypothetical protein
MCLRDDVVILAYRLIASQVLTIIVQICNESYSHIGRFALAW